MIIIGCDFHARYQQIEMLDEATGELAERASATALRATHVNALENLMMLTLRSHALQSSTATALRTGTRVEKINSTHGDSQPNGAHGIVTSSLGLEMWHGQMTQGYLVTWDDCKAAAFVVGSRIRKLVKG
jgi:hypothetical protein